MSKKAAREQEGLWSASFGFLPHKVTVFENPEKDWVLYLRWRASGNWRKKSLGEQLRDAKGKIIPKVEQMARDAAEKQYDLLAGKRAGAAAVAVTKAPLTIGKTWAIISAPKTGRYPVETKHTKEMAEMLAIAARIWSVDNNGVDIAWNDVDAARIRMLGRTRVDELRARAAKLREEGRRYVPIEGLHGAEKVVRRVLTVAAWLRDAKLIAIDACLAPRVWREELRTYWTQVAKAPLPEPKRPRYTLPESRQLLAVAGEIDPRFELHMQFGAEQRSIQVARLRRSALSTEHWTLKIPTSGKKGGALQELTRGQRAAFERAIGPGGYLEFCEKELADYYFFPNGKLPGRRLPYGKRGGKYVDPARAKHAKPVGETALRKWYLKAEDLAHIKHVDGRLSYGVRRIATDAITGKVPVDGVTIKVSEEALQESGGWASSEVPKEIYRDQDATDARREARDARARVRGETE